MRLLLFISLIMLVSCASGVQKLRKIQPGMTQIEVDDIMGARDGFKVSDYRGSTFTLFSYTNHLCNAHVSIYEKCDFYVIFRDNKVIETGTKDVRSSAPKMHYFYVFNQ